MRRRPSTRGRGPARPPGYPQKYEFDKLPLLSRAEFEAVEGLYRYLPPTVFEDNFFEMLNQVLSQFMGGATFVGVHSIQHVPFGAWRQRVPEEGTIAVLGLLPHQSKCVLHLDMALASFLVDRLTGGPGASPTELRPLTPVEKGIVEFLLLQSLAVVDRSFGHMAQVRPRLERFEDSTHGLVDVAQDEEGAVVVHLEFVLGEVAEDGVGSPSLTLLNGPDQGRSLELEEEFDKLLLGRSEKKAQIVINHGSISREHAMLARSGGVTTVTDLGSRNGLFLNDERITGTHQLQGGDVFKLGAIAIRYVEPEKQIVKEQRKDFLSLCVPYPFLHETLVAPYQGRGLSPMERGFYLKKAQRLCGMRRTTVRAEVGCVNLSADELERLEEGDVIVLDEATAQRMPDGSYSGDVTVRLGRGQAFGFQGTLLSGEDPLAIQLTDYSRQEALNVAERL